MSSDDPADIRTIAVSAEDVVAAVAATRRSGDDAVLRITPPFSGRMRARLHVEGSADYEETPRPVHIPPDDLVADSAPPYPTPAETEDRLRTDSEETYSPERHHDYHAAAVAAWRESLTDHVVDTVAIATPGGQHEVEVTLLG